MTAAAIGLGVFVARWNGSAWRDTTLPYPMMWKVWRDDGEPVVLAQGAEMGRFLLGSTVILLFPKNVLTFTPDWAPARAVRLGEAMATTV